MNLVLSPVILALQIFTGAFFINLCLSIFSAAKLRFFTTYRVVAYCTTAELLLFLCYSLFVFICYKACFIHNLFVQYSFIALALGILAWYLVILVKGISASHQLSKLKVCLALFFSVVFFIICIFILIMLIARIVNSFAD
jgi:hypothetical protein